jgi:hypothetical protein
MLCLDIPTKNIGLLSDAATTKHTDGLVLCRFHQNDFRTFFKTLRAKPFGP